jgi:hypothetical protein
MGILLVLTGLTHYVALVAAVAFAGVLVASTAKELYQRTRSAAGDVERRRTVGLA